LKKTNNTIKHYNTYEGFIGKLNEDPEYKIVSIHSGNQEPVKPNTRNNSTTSTVTQFIGNGSRTTTTTGSNSTTRSQLRRKPYESTD
jgi:hypothetical protein